MLCPCSGVMLYVLCLCLLCAVCVLCTVCFLCVGCFVCAVCVVCVLCASCVLCVYRVQHVFGRFPMLQVYETLIFTLALKFKF